ncbi:MAG: CAP domain-containing protein [Bacteroidota bacterium]
MKIKELIVSSFLFFCYPSFLLSKGKPELVRQLYTIKKAVETDSIQYIERLAAFYFHQEINEYRKANKKSILVWDDTLWLASRNHCLWMLVNAQCSHNQKNGTYFFTGLGPGERIQYVSEGKSHLNWSGENVYYDSYSACGKVIDKIAKGIAFSSFNAWKNSPGHNENMLRDDSYGHGVAFIISGTSIRSTDLFMYHSNNYIEQTFNLPTSPNFIEKKKFDLVDVSTSLIENVNEKSNSSVNSKTNKIKLKNVSKPVSIPQKEKELSLIIQKFLIDSLSEKNKALEIASKYHLNYLLSNKSPCNQQQKGRGCFYGATPEIRVLKASHYLGYFKNKRTALAEHVSILFFDENNFTTLNIIQKLSDELEISRKNQKKSKVMESAYAIRIKKDKEKYVVYFVMLERMKKSKKSIHLNDEKI